MLALYRNHMGNDLEVVNDARISFAKASKAKSWKEYQIPDQLRCSTTNTSVAYIPELNAADLGLISFLARGCMSGDWEEALDSVAIDLLDQDEAHRLLTWAKRLPTHWTPFAQQTIKLRMKAPVPIRTQCFKHKIGMVENEESRRYINSIPELYIPEFRARPEGSIKQGSGGLHPRNAHWKLQYEIQSQSAITLYDDMIKDGVAPEQARFVLPQGVMVNWVWTGSLYAFAEFYNKRSDTHAQGEIQELAQAVANIIQPLFPVSWAALTE